MTRKLFFQIIPAAFALIFIYLTYQLFWHAHFSWPLATLATTLLAILFASILWLPLLRWREDESANEARLKTLLDWLAYGSMGFLSLLLLLTVFRDMVGLSAKLWSKSPLIY